MIVSVFAEDAIVYMFHSFFTNMFLINIFVLLVHAVIQVHHNEILRSSRYSLSVPFIVRYIARIIEKIFDFVWRIIWYIPYTQLILVIENDRILEMFRVCAIIFHGIFDG